MTVLKALRQAIPILDVAIDRLVRLTGKVIVTWESPRVQAAWDEWQSMVSVPPLLRGFNTSLNGLQSRALMFGTGVREIEFDALGRQVKAFRFIAPDTVRFRQDPEDAFGVVVAQTQSGQITPVVLERQFIDIAAHDPRDDSPYGRSIFADCPFVGELLLEMVHATKQNWIRVGTPAFGVLVGIPQNIDAAVDLGTLMQSLLDQIKSDWTTAMTARQTAGKITDFFAAGDVKIVTIGADGQMLDFQIPWRAILEQVIGATHLPPWMLGMHWSTTERLSTEQAQSLEGVILDYQADVTPNVLWAADWWARANGFADDEREVGWPAASLRDRVEEARAGLMEAQAEQTRQKVGRQLWADGVVDQQGYAGQVLGEENTPVAMPLAQPAPPVDSNPSIGGFSSQLALAAKNATPLRCSCGHEEKTAADAPTSIGQNEEHRNPSVREAIQLYHGDMRQAAHALRLKLWQILKLPELGGATASVESPVVTKDAVPEEVIFEQTQEAAFDRAVEVFLTRMAGRDRSRMGFVAVEPGNGIVQQWNRYAYAVGVNGAAEQIGSPAAETSLAADSAAVQAMLANSFGRLSENGRLRLEDNLGELKGMVEEAVQLGTNPLDLAREMSGRFDAYEGWEFERLARTEVAFADVQGEMDEYRAQGVDASGVEDDPPPWHP
jgi:hypothetical protein